VAQDHNDIYTIVERLRMLEEGLNTNQRRVNQLSATFKPKTVAVLTAKTDPKNPMAGKMVGGCEESEEPVLEAEMAEDILEKVKSSFKDFIKKAEEEIKDSDIKEKKKGDSDLKAKDKTDRDLVTKEDSELGSALSGIVPAAQPAGEPGVSIKETAAVKTVTNECGLWEMHGDKHNGFEIRRSGRSLPTRFKTLDEAEMAIEMFAHRQRRHNEAQDYIDEA
jgi:hypothetical protein